jgi:hypothetical protein
VHHTPRCGTKKRLPLGALFVEKNSRMLRPLPPRFGGTCSVTATSLMAPLGCCGGALSKEQQFGAREAVDNDFLVAHGRSAVARVAAGNLVATWTETTHRRVLSASPYHSNDGSGGPPMCTLRCSLKPLTAVPAWPRNGGVDVAITGTAGAATYCVVSGTQV